MTHSYYLDTISNIRSTGRIITDIILISFTLVFVMAGLNMLRSKGYIGNFHETWTNYDNTGSFIP